jgi:hypothetical protein
LAAAKEQDALQFAYALAVADPENGKTVLDKYRWYQGLKRPALALRWGIGVDYNKPNNFNGDPKPPGSRQNLPQGRRGARGGAGGALGVPGGGDLGMPGGGYGAGMPGEVGPGGGAGGGLKRLTGELGDKVLEQLRVRLEKGAFGELLTSVPRRRSAGGFAGGYGGPAGMPGGIPGDPAGGGYGDPAGMPGGIPGDPAGGGYGGPAGIPGGVPGNPAGGGAARGNGGRTSLMPGVTYLGEAESKELLRQAAEEGLDALIVFDVNVTQNPRNRLTINNTKVELYIVAKRDKVEATKVLNNVEIQREKEQGRERDTLAREVEDLFEAADKAGLTAAPNLPAALQPEHVKGRIGTLSGDTHDNPLWVLAEARFYHYRQFLTDQELKQAYAAFIGEDNAAKLAEGSAAERLEVVVEWLPKIGGPARGRGR